MSSQPARYCRRLDYYLRIWETVVNLGTENVTILALVLAFRVLSFELLRGAQFWVLNFEFWIIGKADFEFWILSFELSAKPILSCSVLSFELFSSSFVFKFCIQVLCSSFCVQVLCSSFCVQVLCSSFCVQVFEFWLWVVEFWFST